MLIQLCLHHIGGTVSIFACKNGSEDIIFIHGEDARDFLDYIPVMIPGKINPFFRAIQGVKEFLQGIPGSFYFTGILIFM